MSFSRLRPRSLKPWALTVATTCLGLLLAVLLDKPTAASPSYSKTLFQETEQCLRSEGLSLNTKRTNAPYALTFVGPGAWLEAFKPPTTAYILFFFASHQAANRGLTREVAFVQSMTKLVNTAYRSSPLPIPSAANLRKTYWITGSVLYWSGGTPRRPIAVRQCLERP